MSVAGQSGSRKIGARFAFDAGVAVKRGRLAQVLARGAGVKGGQYGEILDS